MATKKSIKQTELADPPSIVESIAPVGDLSHAMSALFYGRSGTGKTTLAATFPKPILVIDVREKGTESIAQVKEVDVVSIEKWSQFEELYWYLESGKSKYSTVVIDAVSGLQELAMAQVRKEENLEDADLLPRRVWGQISGMMKTWLFSYRDLIAKDINVVFNAHDRTNEAEEGVEDQIDPSIGPRLMPSVAAAVNGAVSYIGNTFIRERYVGDGKDKTRVVDYCLRIGPHSFYITKARRPKEAEAAPDVLINPTYEKILAISRGESVVKRKRKE